MKREAWKVALACAIGAGIGSLTALEVAKMFWWVGLIVGGLTGYLSYEWRAVLAAIPAAYRAARGWQAPPRYWEAWVLIILHIINATFTALLLSLIVGLIPKPTFLALLIATPLLIGTLMSVLLVFIAAMHLGELRQQGWDPEIIGDFRKLLFQVSAPIVLFWHLPRGFIWLARQVPSVTVSFASFLRRFGWELFCRIHSEMRLLCGVDAAIGNAVGYFAGSAIIGAIAGGLVGVANYLVVTERWLKPRGYLAIRS